MDQSSDVLVRRMKMIQLRTTKRHKHFCVECWPLACSRYDPDPLKALAGAKRKSSR